MEDLPPNPEQLLLTEWRISNNPKDMTLAGLTLRCEYELGRFLLTRQQLLDLGQACLQTAEKMQKPS